MSTQRTITVVATKGGRIEKITTDAATWGDLKALIQDKYDLSNLKAVENINKTTLEHIDATLPEGDFRLFLRATKTKSGVDFSQMSFGDMRNDYIKPNEEVKNFLNRIAGESGRNWTQLKTDELREGLNLFYSPSTNASPEEVETTSDVSETKAIDKIKLAKNLIQEVVQKSEHILSEDDFSEVEDRFGEISVELDTIVEILESYFDLDNEETAEERIEREAKEAAERAEQEDIQREFNEMEDGF